MGETNELKIHIGERVNSKEMLSIFTKDEMAQYILTIHAIIKDFRTNAENVMSIENLFTTNERDARDFINFHADVRQNMETFFRACGMKFNPICVETDDE